MKLLRYLHQKLSFVTYVHMRGQHTCGHTSPPRSVTGGNTTYPQPQILILAFKEHGIMKFIVGSHTSTIICCQIRHQQPTIPRTPKNSRKPNTRLYNQNYYEKVDHISSRTPFIPLWYYWPRPSGRPSLRLEHWSLGRGWVPFSSLSTWAIASYRIIPSLLPNQQLNETPILQGKNKTKEVRAFLNTYSCGKRWSSLFRVGALVADSACSAVHAPP